MVTPADILTHWAMQRDVTLPLGPLRRRQPGAAHPVAQTVNRCTHAVLGENIQRRGCSVGVCQPTLPDKANGKKTQRTRHLASVVRTSVR